MPNFFDYAYDERSQDAVICWLINWSAVQAENPDERALRDLGRAFVNSLLGKHEVTLNGEIQSAEIYQQDRSIDILVRIADANAEHVLLIEDKVAEAPSPEEMLRRLCDRLQGYRDSVTNGETQLEAVHEHLPVYLTTANQSLAKDHTIEETGYRVFRRNDFLEVLNRYQGPHPVVTDFRDHLQKLENDFMSFEARNANDAQAWSRAGWEGFYQHLEELLKGQLEGEGENKDGWGYVPNAGGGFLGFGRELPGSNFYLLLEVYPGDPNRQRLCFKVYREERNYPARQVFHDLLIETAGDLGLETRIQPPVGPDRGYNITFGRFEPWMAYNEDGTFDYDGIVGNWQQAWRIIGQVGKRFVQQ